MIMRDKLVYTFYCTFHKSSNNASNPVSSFSSISSIYNSSVSPVLKSNVKCFLVTRFNVSPPPLSNNNARFRFRCAYRNSLRFYTPLGVLRYCGARNCSNTQQLRVLHFGYNICPSLSHLYYTSKETLFIIIYYYLINNKQPNQKKKK